MKKSWISVEQLQHQQKLGEKSKEDKVKAKIKKQQNTQVTQIKKTHNKV